MQPRCTCGAVLPDDARFCHKCGKPQFEEDLARLSAQETSSAPVQSLVTPAAGARTAPGISFKNSRAVLVSLLVAGGTLIGLMAIGLLIPPLAPLVLCAAGFVAARVYRSQSAEPLTTVAGARLGWMTGLWMFLVLVILFAMTALFVSNPEAWQRLKSSWAQWPQMSTFLNLSQHDFVVQLLVSLPFSFLLLTLLPGLGGMLGAKMSAPRPPS